MFIPMSTLDIIDTAAIVIESIWLPLPGSAECSQKQKGLPLRTFIQETLKRSRSSYSTLQTALFYLYKIRNKVPCYLKRRQDQLYLTQASQPVAGYATPPASPHPQSHPYQSPPSDYFSSRAPVHSGLPSPQSSIGASPASGYSPCSSSSASPASNLSNSSSPVSPLPCSVSSSSAASSSLSCSVSTSSTTTASSSSSSSSNRIIYCGRRTFLASLMVASKYLQDRNYSNKAWAKISGLSIKEINSNELIFLKLIDYSLFVSHETFMRWTALLVAHGQEATRKFIQTADVAQASAFAARVMAVPPVALDSSQIRYAPLKSTPSSFAAVEACWSHQEKQQEEPKIACGVQNGKVASDMSRSAKISRTAAYLPIQGHGSNSSNGEIGETVVY